MLRKTLLGSAVFLGLGTSYAAANCSLNGYSYPVGTVLCFDTFVQECTVAGYWKAIGNCRSTDPRFELTERPEKIGDKIHALLIAEDAATKRKVSQTN